MVEEARGWEKKGAVSSSSGKEGSEGESRIVKGRKEKMLGHSLLG